MARGLISGDLWDTRTLAGSRIEFVDGCKGTISGASQPFATVHTVGDSPHIHSFEYAWPTVAYSYVNNGKRFPIR